MPPIDAADRLAEHLMAVLVALHPLVEESSLENRGGSWQARLAQASPEVLELGLEFYGERRLPLKYVEVLAQRGLEVRGRGVGVFAYAEDPGLDVLDRPEA